MFEDEMAIFYDTSEFAVQCTAAPSGAVFAGTLSTVDDERFGGQVMAGVHVLQYPTAAAVLRKGDAIVTQALHPDGTPQGAPTSWTVHKSPDRVGDGAESVAYLLAAA